MECYPIAKVGGLGDVVGALSIYLNQQKNLQVHTFIPHYCLTSLERLTPQSIQKYEILIGKYQYSAVLYSYLYQDFYFHSVDIGSLFYSSGIYADPETKRPFPNELERYIGFSVALLELCRKQLLGMWDIFHIHDHHLAVLSILARYHARYYMLANIRQVLTIHNGHYKGLYPIKVLKSHPILHLVNRDRWITQDEQVNMLASSMISVDHITTVSSEYALEITENTLAIPKLNQPYKKIQGITNGIVSHIWTPSKDKNIFSSYSQDIVEKGKEINRLMLYRKLNWDNDAPLCCFIGRMVKEKGADLLPIFFSQLSRHFPQLRLIILGTGQEDIEKIIIDIFSHYPSNVKIFLTYNEKLAHQLYASSDFLLMPSRVEPCGLNQFYAMTYGTIPIVHSTGGLKETVIDIKENEGRGICMPSLDEYEIQQMWKRASSFYSDYSHFSRVRRHIMSLDFSWDSIIKTYLKMYSKLINIPMESTF